MENHKNASENIQNIQQTVTQYTNLNNNVNNNLKSSFYRKNTLCFDTKNNFHFLIKKDIQPKDKINIIESSDKNKLNLNEDINSETTSTISLNDKIKIKRVTFSTIEIIRVEKYKKYNKLNYIKKNDSYKDSLNPNCILF